MGSFCRRFFVEAIHAATERVWITSPYFIPDEAVFAALRLAVLRGVDVRLLLPSRPDHRIVYAASSLYAFEAVRAGVRVFRYEPGFLHQKVVLIDSEISAIGSANLVLFKLAPNASGLEIAAYLVGGPFGIVASMTAYQWLRRYKTDS